jgi:hypothetical protein
MQSGIAWLIATTCIAKKAAKLKSASTKFAKFPKFMSGLKYYTLLCWNTLFISKDDQKNIENDPFVSLYLEKFFTMFLLSFILCHLVLNNLFALALFFHFSRQ